MNPEAGPVQRLAHELRILRRGAGSPAYRVMAHRVGVSVTSLSQAAAGEKLPSIGVTLAYARACGGDESAWELRWKLAAEALREPPQSEPALPIGSDRTEDEGESPYRGLTRFDAGDRELFFGRERPTAELLDLVREHRFAALFGASGSGKSSLLRAGLIPRLQEHAQRLGRPAVVRVLTPGERPAATYGHLLAPGEGEPDSWVIVDQFEEVFTVCRDRDERARFIDLLLAARDPGTRLRAVIAMRADFYGLCARHPELAEALRHNGLLLGPMSATELREAVTGPASAAGLVVERRLTARIVEEVVDQPGGLPTLSHALLETWRRRRGRILTLEAYEEAGGVEGAVAATAERVYGQLTDDQARTARRLLMRLISPGEGTADTRRALERAELDEWPAPGAGAVIEQLAAARLLTIDGDSVELAHEALIGSWPRLRDWIEQDRDRLRQQRLLGEAARAWHHLDRDPGALYRGTRLDQAAELFARPGRERELTASEQAFLDASLDARERELRAAVHARRRRRGVRATLSALLAVMLTVSLAAWQQNRTDIRESNQATARRIAEVAYSLRTTDPRTAMQLSAASWHIAQLPETRAALLASVSQPEQDAFTDPSQSTTSKAFLVDSGRTLLNVDGRGWHAWNTATHRQTGSGTLPGSLTALSTASPDGRLLALDVDGGWRLWNLATGSWTGAAQATSGDYFPSFGAAPNSYLAVAIQGSQAQLDAITGGTRLLTTDIDSETNVATSADGRLLAICPLSGPITVRDLVHGRELSGDWSGPDGRGCADQNSRLLFDPAADRLAAVSSSGARIWNTATGSLIADLDYPQIATATFSPGGGFLAAAGPDEIAVWRLSAPSAPVFRQPLDGERLLGDLAWDPGKPELRYLEGGTVHTLDLGEAATTAWQSTPIGAAALSPDGRILAIARPTGNDYVFQLVDTADKRAPRLLPPVALPVPQDGAGPIVVQDAMPLMAFSPDSKTFAYGISAQGRTTSAQDVTIWDAAHSRVRTTLDLAPSSGAAAIDAIMPGPDGTTLIAARSQDSGEGGEVWDAARRRITTRLGSFAGAAFGMRPDGRLLVGDNAVTALPGGPNRDRILSLGQEIEAVAFTADGTLAAVGDASGRVAIWNGTLTRRLGVLPGAFPAPAPGASPEAVSALAFSPDGSTLAVAGDAGDLQLWDTTSRQALGGNLTTAGEDITALAFSPDDATLYASSLHVPLQSYPVTPASALSRICARTTGDLTPAQWSTYIPQVPYQGTCGDG